jgi:hypothetical protein
MALIQDATGDLAFAQTLETALLNDLQANTPQGVNSKVALSIRAGDTGADRRAGRVCRSSGSSGWWARRRLW